jgi:hypothetical protein
MSSPRGEKADCEVAFARWCTRDYFSEVLIVVNRELSLMPTPVTAAITPVNQIPASSLRTGK